MPQLDPSRSDTYLTHEQDRTTSKAWNDKDERQFKVALERELDKIYQFQKEKVYLLSGNFVLPRLISEYHRHENYPVRNKQTGP